MFLKKNFFLFLISGILFALPSCKDDDPIDLPEDPTTYEDGIFIINQGPFQNGTGTISFYSRESGLMADNIFQKANDGEELGNIVQSMTIYNDLVYIVVNNSNKIVIANATSFEKVGEITNFELPRYFLPVGDDKAFVSQWGSDGVTGSIKVIDLNTNTISNTIDTRPGPESMIKVDDFVYVTNLGGFTTDSVISKIDIATETVLSSIEVGLRPVSIVLDKNGDLWTISEGDYNTLDNGALSKISNDNLELSLATPYSFVDLTINTSGDMLYYVTGGMTYQHAITDTALTSSPLISRYFFKLGVDSQTDELMALDAKGFSQNGQMLIYNSDGTALDSIDVGVAPGGFWFD